MHLLYKLSTNRFTTYIPQIQNKETWQISQNNHNLKASLHFSSRSQYTNLARHGNGVIKHFKYECNKTEHQKP